MGRGRSGPGCRPDEASADDEIALSASEPELLTSDNARLACSPQSFPQAIAEKDGSVASDTLLIPFLDSLVTQPGAFSAVSAVIWQRGDICFVGGASAGSNGAQRVEPEIAGNRLFDLASLTKPFVATLAVALDRAQILSLDAPIGSALPECLQPLCDSPLEDLLRHRSRLRAWLPLYSLCADPEHVASELLDPRWWGARAGTYSDLGYMLWQKAVEETTGGGLEELLSEHVLRSLALHDVMAAPGRGENVAACLCDTAREVELAAAMGLQIGLQPAPVLGQPQDGNARFLGRLSAHAGLFGSALSVVQLGVEWLAPETVLTPPAVGRALAGAGPYALGFARRLLRGSAGPALSRRAFGHTGFTGGSLWIDPSLQAVFVLLGHRTEPKADLNRIRRRFHRLAVRWLTVSGC